MFALLRCGRSRESDAVDVQGDKQWRVLRVVACQGRVPRVQLIPGLCVNIAQEYLWCELRAPVDLLLDGFVHRRSWGALCVSAAIAVMEGDLNSVVFVRLFAGQHPVQMLLEVP